MPSLTLKYLLGLFIVAACCTPQVLRAAEPLEADRIVSVVGADVITLHELQNRIKAIKAQLGKQGTPLPPEDVLRKQVLERMILDLAQLQQGQELGIQVDNEQLDEAIERIAANNKLAVPQFKKSIEKEGIPFSVFREEIRKEITVSRVRQREVENRVSVSDSEVDNYLEQQKTTQTATQLHLAHILFRIPENTSQDFLNKLQAKAEQVLKRLNSGENFAKLAATYSDAPDATQGGDLGWRPVDRLPSMFAEVGSKLQPGQTSGLFRSPAGVHLLLLIDRKDGGLDKQAVKQTHARHILIKVNELVSETEAKHKLTLLRDRLTHGTSFAELARLHSQDGSAAKGGDLGWLYPGDTVPEFERAMDELKPGVVSQPVQSPFGFHLIEVLERKVQDASDERKRQQARQALRERKVEEAYADWLQQLRDRIYVEYRLEEQ